MFHFDIHFIARGKWAAFKWPHHAFSKYHNCSIHCHSFDDDLQTFDALNLFAQDSKPELITAIEECIYTFLWVTAAACPLKSNVQNNCSVINPRTGNVLDINVGLIS